VPLSLRPPRKGKTPNFEIRGTVRGPKGPFRVETSSGTARRSDARKLARQITECIQEHGCWPAPETPRHRGDDFVSAAVAYMEAGGERRYVRPLIKHFGSKPIAEIDQVAIDGAAVALYPDGAPDYRNRAVYTPLSAILHHALGDKCPTVRRPKGSKGRERTDFLWPDDAFLIIGEADKIDEEFGLYLRMLLYTGIRKSEGLDLLSANVRPDDQAAWVQTSKNEDPRMLKLREDIVGPLRLHLEKAGDHLFRFHDGGHFKHYLTRARMAASGLPCPKRRPNKWKEPPHRLKFATFHIFRHTFATWFSFYGGGDNTGLVGTGNWRDEKSTRRYRHVVRRMEWDRVENMPSEGNRRGKGAA
jgi:integrase